MKILVTDIEWDVDDEEDMVDLPSELTLETNEDLHGDELEEWISDEISNETGFCHRGFQYENGEIV